MLMSVLYSPPKDSFPAFLLPQVQYYTILHNFTEESSDEDEIGGKAVMSLYSLVGNNHRSNFHTLDLLR